jgi:copper chaperone NosL
VKRTLRRNRADFKARSTKSHEFTPNKFVSLSVVSWIVIAGILLVSCQKSMIGPVAIAPEDMCAYCKMAISEKRYAAEFIDSEGQAFKFDDIGCMVNFIKSKKNTTKIVAYFVMDFDERQWIKATDASYVRSSELNTPMNGGIIAFKNQAKAKEAADRYHGKLIRFEDLFNLKG